MNKAILMGRLTRDPEVRYSQSDTSMAIARFSLAVDRRFQKNSDGAIEKGIYIFSLPRHVSRDGKRGETPAEAPPRGATQASPGCGGRRPRPRGKRVANVPCALEGRHIADAVLRRMARSRLSCGAL